MKVIKTASGKKTLKISKSEWETIGKTAGWIKEADDQDLGYYYQAKDALIALRDAIEEKENTMDYAPGVNFSLYKKAIGTWLESMKRYYEDVKATNRWTPITVSTIKQSLSHFQRTSDGFELLMEDDWFKAKYDDAAKKLGRLEESIKRDSSGSNPWE